jgi:hypothetical protein
MKNQHLIPINVQDIVDKLEAAKNENEINNYLLRLEAIRDYCENKIHTHRIRYEKNYSNKSIFRKKK